MDDEFEIFWRYCLRKKSKGDAYKAWRQTAKDRPPLERLLDALGRANREWEHRDPRYIPYPATWLRAQGWLDEPDPEPAMDPLMADWYKVNGGR